MSCPRCAGDWQEIGPEGGECDDCGFVPRQEIDNPTRQEDSQTLGWLTAAELATRTPSAPPWVVSPFLALGVRTMLSGKPKASGKTTFALRMIRCVIDGTAFLSTLPERRGPAVLLSEEGSVSLNQAIRRAGLQDSKHLHILQFRPGWKWRDVARDAIQKARSVGAVILVIDTLPQWAQIPGDAENSAGVAREVFDPFSGVDDLAMVFNFHDRKSGGEPGEATRGSGAFAGAVDLIVDIRRVGGNGQERRRELSLLGRFEVPEKLIVELTDDGYSLLGNTTDVNSLDLQNAIKEALDGRTRTEQELIGVLPDAKTSIGKELRKLVDKGEVGRKGDGKRNSPYVYFVSPTPYIDSVGETNSHNLNGGGDELEAEHGLLVQLAVERFGLRVIETG